MLLRHLMVGVMMVEQGIQTLHKVLVVVAVVVLLQLEVLVLLVVLEVLEE